MTRLRPEQSAAGSVLQAASVSANDAESNILVRLARYGQQNEFVTRYGDDGEDEFDGGTGTIPQRLLMMNGVLVHDKIKPDAFNGSIAASPQLAPDDPHAVETALLSPMMLDAPADSRRGGAFRVGVGRQGPDARTAVGRSLLGAHQLDGILMEPLTRRGFLRVAGLAGATWLTPISHVLARAAEAPGTPRDHAQSIIMLWMQGGPSQLETFDPHPDTRHRRRAPGPSTRRSRPYSTRPASERTAEEMGSISPDPVDGEQGGRPRARNAIDEDRKASARSDGGVSVDRGDLLPRAVGRSNT